MKRTIVLMITLTASLLFAGAHDSLAGNYKKYITPYGDYCSTVSHYGMHHGILDNSQVGKALKHYFSKSGLHFKIIGRRGRFVKAHVIDDGEVVDTIILDRYSGRIRSIQ